MRGSRYREKTFEEVENIIQSVQYKEAKEYYRKLREQLYNFLSKISNENTASLFIDSLIGSIQERLLEKTPTGHLASNDLIFKRLPDQLVETVTKAIVDGDTNVINNYKEQYLNIKTEDYKQAEKEINKILQDVVETLNLSDNLLNFIRVQGKLNKNAIDLSDIKAQLPAFQKSIIKQYFEQGEIKSGDGKRGGNLATVSGYYQEAIIADAIYNLLTKLDLNIKKGIGVKQIGAIKLKGKDTPYDIAIFNSLTNDLEEIPKNLQQLNSSIEISKSLDAFGIQSKRSSLPTRFTYKRDEEKKALAERRLLKKYQGTSTAFTIGERAQLKEKYRNRYRFGDYHWTSALEFLGSAENAKEALGPGNVMWVVGNTPYWTDSFIETFTNNRMRLNFEFLLDSNRNESIRGKAMKAQNKVVLAYHNHNLRSAMINRG